VLHSSHPPGDVGSEKDVFFFLTQRGRSERLPTMELLGIGNAGSANERIIIFGSSSGIHTCGEEMMGVSVIIRQCRGEEWNTHIMPHVSQIPSE